MSDKKVLTEQQEVFCRHYVITHNGKESATLAGYSPDSATSQASRMLKKPEIQERIQELEGEFTTDLDVIAEIEKQYVYANQQGHTNSAIKALEMLARFRGNSSDQEHKTPESMEREIIRCMEILGEEKVVELVSKCNWNYSLPTEEEQAEAEEMIKNQTKEE